MNSVFRDWLDSAAIGASSLCLIHCVLLPLAIIILPFAASATEATEFLHFWGLMIAIPTSLYALGMGHRPSGSRRLLGLGVVALSFLLAGAMLEDFWLLGSLITGIGSLLLVHCHIRNWQMRRA